MSTAPRALVAGTPTEDRPLGSGRRAQSLDREECIRLLRSASLGRLVFTDRALPAIVPVNFGMDDGTVIVQVAKDSRVARAADGAVVAFEVDRIDETSRTGWSVVVVGHARRCDRERSGASTQPTWVSGEHDVCLAVDLDQVTGRNLVPG